MDKESLETYQVQLSQVELALVADPDNAELASLRSELQELINLTTTLISQSESAASASKSTDSSRKATTTQNSVTWSAGDECLAKYSGDGGWYPARINSVAGSAEKRVYSIVFKSYNTTEQLEASSLKPLPPNHSHLRRNSYRNRRVGRNLPKSLRKRVYILRGWQGRVYLRPRITLLVVVRLLRPSLHATVN